MKNNHKKHILYILTGLALLFQSCTSLQPYEMIYINDFEMQMNSSSQQNFQLYIQSIREGSITAGSIKSSGGCGCN